MVLHLFYLRQLTWLLITVAMSTYICGAVGLVVVELGSRLVCLFIQITYPFCSEKVNRQQFFLNPFQIRGCEICQLISKFCISAKYIVNERNKTRKNQKKAFGGFDKPCVEEERITK